MSVVFAAVLKETDEGRTTLPITNEIMEAMGVDQVQLKEAATNNLAEQDYSFKSMRDVLIGMMFPDGVPENDPMVEMMLPPEDPDTQMYVLSNNQNVNGASEILNQKAMDEIAEKLGGDFVVLPSSVHETIVIPLKDDMERGVMENMVQEINSGVVLRISFQIKCSSMTLRIMSLCVWIRWKSVSRRKKLISQKRKLLRNLHLSRTESQRNKQR